MTQTITLRELHDANRRAFDAKTLGAFHHDFCVYAYGGDDPYRCAIGAVLTDETLERILIARLNSSSLFPLKDQGIVNFANNEDFYAAEFMQVLHDNWSAHAHDNDDEEFRKPIGDLHRSTKVPAWVDHFVACNATRLPSAAVFDDFLREMDRNV